MYKLNFTILELELLSFLSMRAGEKFSQRELAKYLKVSPTAVGNSLIRLRNEQYVNSEKVKTVNLISFNRDNRRAIQFKKVDNLKNLYLSGLVDFLEEQLAGSTIILFGSYSRGEDIKNSDIDLAVIGRKSKGLDLTEYERVLFRKIHVNFYDSWRNIHKHLKNNILNGIVLAGGVEL